MAASNPTQNEPVSCPVGEEWPDDWQGRQAFLLALRRVAPEFWRELNRVWRSREPIVEQWLQQHGVVDHWLMLALFETLLAWDSDPDGPNASLEPDYPWYCYFCRLETPNEIPDFAPVFSDPSPIANKGCSAEEFVERWHNTPGKELPKLLAGVPVESLDDFEKRMERQFRSQLKAYRNGVESVFNYGKNPQRSEHAEWTARVFMGDTRALIAARAYSKYENGENAVARAVTRFSKAIRLTLPG